MEVLLKLKAAIEAELEGYFAGTEFFLVEVRVLPGYKIYVFADSTHNITIQQCATVSRHLEEFLETNNLVPEQYMLEVSSPGLDQPFRVSNQYEKAINTDVEVVLKDGRKLEGRLTDVSTSGLTLLESVMKKGKLIEEKVHDLSFEEIKTTKKTIIF